MAIIRIKRGLKANIPTLYVGEPGFCTDTQELFVGTVGGNKLVGDGTFLKLTGGTLTGALHLPLAAPTQATQAANKRYVDNVASGLDVKASVKCVSTVNQPMVPNGGDHNKYTYINFNPVIIDGYTLVVGDRILLVGQSDSLQNGIFVVEMAGDGTVPTMLTRPADATNGTLTGGAFVFVERGTTYGDTGWVCTTDDNPLIIGSTLIEFTQFTGAGSSSFVALSDTPSSYASQNGKLVRVNEVADGLEFFSPTFLDLDDTPTGYGGSGGSLVRVKEDRTGLEFINPSTVGRTTFLQLEDTPSAYQSGRLLVSGDSSIVFTTAKVFGGLFGDVPNDISANGKTLVSNEGSMVFRDFKTTGLLDMPATIGDEGQMLRVNAGRTALEYFTSEDSPVSSSKTPISAGWAFTHNAQSSGTHGAPAGKALLHQDSEIDGGTF